MNIFQTRARAVADRSHPLPYDFENPKLTDTSSYRVDVQEVVRNGESLLIARVQVPTPTEHAYILRRLDTGAVSLTTMFHAAFPGAPSQTEMDECRWVSRHLDIAHANRIGGVNLSGTWIPASIAEEIAPSYGLQHAIESLLAAEVIPNADFSRGARTVLVHQSNGSILAPTHGADSVGNGRLRRPFAASATFGRTPSPINNTFLADRGHGKSARRVTIPDAVKKRNTAAARPVLTRARRGRALSTESAKADSGASSRLNRSFMRSVTQRKVIFWVVVAVVAAIAIGASVDRTPGNVPTTHGSHV